MKTPYYNTVYPRCVVCGKHTANKGDKYCRPCYYEEVTGKKAPESYSMDQELEAQNIIPKQRII